MVIKRKSVLTRGYNVIVIYAVVNDFDLAQRKYEKRQRQNQKK
jgi:hypothetical protein